MASIALRHQHSADVARLLLKACYRGIPVIAFDAVVARIHARMAAELASLGTAVGPHDLIIAATAIAKGYAVVTRDERSFPKISGLNLLRW